MSYLHNARKGRTISLGLMAALLPVGLSGCALHPDLGPKPELSSPASLETSRTFAAPEAAWPSDSWWKSYNDPQLTSLIETALSGSPSLAAAAARVRQADSQLQSARSSRSVAVQGNGSIQSSYQELDADGLPAQIKDALPDDVQTKASASIGLSRQLDFFGKNRANIAAAPSSASAARAEEAAARLYSDRKAAQDAIRVRTESADLVGQRLRNGLENEGRVYQAKAEVSAANVDLASIDGQIARTRNALAALLGKGPDAGLAIAEPSNPQIASAGLPSNLALDLIGRRPDIVAARLYAEAASEKITVAKADFYPNVNLSAVIGIQTLGLDRLGGGDLSYVQAGPAVSLPIFDGGNVEGRYRNARAKYDEAAATYNDTLTTALKEVADAISDRRSLDAQLTQAHTALDLAEQSYRIVRVRYEGGLASYIDALSAEDQMVDLRRSVASLDARAFALDIALIRALGGGYQENK
jgi:NodT family efflux transporter outer membrane factor (OMF) lipoprotein